MNPKVREMAANFAFMTVFGILLTLVCALLGIVLVKHLNTSDEHFESAVPNLLLSNDHRHESATN